jgi:hypothetical protein
MEWAGGDDAPYPMAIMISYPKAYLLTPKFGKEYDWWVRFEKESVWWKERYF